MKLFLVCATKKVIWGKFTNKLFGDLFKFEDFFESLNITNYTKLTLDEFRKTDNLDKYAISVKSDQIMKLGKQVLDSCPFFISESDRQQRINEWEQYMI